MRRLTFAAALLVGVSVPSPAQAQAQAGPLLGRAFTIAADAFPAEPAPGANQTTLGIRPVATRAGATNPPAAAFGRASATDFGLIEAYIGPQGPTAEADTASANGRPDAHVSEGGMTLDAHASTAPLGRAFATGNGSSGAGFSMGSSSSLSIADGSGAALTATAMAEVHDVVSGPMVIGSARFDGSASVDGTRGGAVAQGRVTASDATVSGIPVVIDEEGLRVDQAAVPADQLPTLTEAVRAALNRGGYIDVRVVQPTGEVAEDGTKASVRGGGVRVRMTNNDPANNYFLEFNLVAGSASVLLGPVIGGGPSGSGGGAPVPVDPPAEQFVTRVLRVDGFDPTATRPVDPGLPPTPAPPAKIEPVTESAAASYRLASRWPGWPWLLALLAAFAAFAASLPFEPMAPVRLRLSLFADRYLRG